VALTLAASEAGGHWSSLVEDLQRRGPEASVLILSDVHVGLRKAIELWPEAKVQRCTWHKWQNLVGHCPVHAGRELKRDWDRILHAEDGMAAREAYASFLAKWRTLCPAVARSLVYAFPKATWGALRTTNSLENLNREFRRRTKTQAFFFLAEEAPSRVPREAPNHPRSWVESDRDRRFQPIRQRGSCAESPREPGRIPVPEWALGFRKPGRCSLGP